MSQICQFMSIFEVEEKLTGSWKGDRADRGHGKLWWLRHVWADQSEQTAYLGGRGFKETGVKTEDHLRNLMHFLWIKACKATLVTSQKYNYEPGNEHYISPLNKINIFLGGGGLFFSRSAAQLELYNRQKSLHRCELHNCTNNWTKCINITFWYIAYLYSLCWNQSSTSFYKEGLKTTFIKEWRDYCNNNKLNL